MKRILAIGLDQPWSGRAVSTAGVDVAGSGWFPRIPGSTGPAGTSMLGRLDEFGVVGVELDPAGLDL